MRVTQLQSRQAIPVYLEVVRLLGDDHIAAIYYKQMVYYDENEPKDPAGFFTKTKSKVYNDTVLSRYQQDRARLKLVALGWIAAKANSFKILRSL